MASVDVCQRQQVNVKLFWNLFDDEKAGQQQKIQHLGTYSASYVIECSDLGYMT